MVQVDEAKKNILDAVKRLPVEDVLLLDALGRIAASRVNAVWNLPQFDNSAMDGYAVRSMECTVGVRLPVKASVMAGERLDVDPGPCCAVKIMTGAPIPPGFDAVIPFEDISAATAEYIELAATVKKGDHIRFAGEDIACGDPILHPGDLVRPAEISMLAASGIVIVPVYRRARVAILSTGDELVEFGQPVPEGKIVNSNAPAIAAAVREAGGEAHMIGIARDTIESLKEKVTIGLGYDMFITTAGVSAGERDLVREALEWGGVKQHFWKVAIKPGGPLAFGMGGDTPVFSLPGNPVSSLLTFEVFVRAALLKMMGHEAFCRRSFKGILEDDLAKKSGKGGVFRIKVREEGGVFYLRLAGNQQTGLQKTLLNADGLVMLPLDNNFVAKGETMEFHFLHDLSMLQKQ